MTDDKFGFGPAPLKLEGTMIDPDTLGSVTTPEREAEVRAMYADRAVKRAAWEKSFAGRWSKFIAPWQRAWHAFRNEDSGL